MEARRKSARLCELAEVEESAGEASSTSWSVAARLVIAVAVEVIDACCPNHISSPLPASIFAKPTHQEQEVPATQSLEISGNHQLRVSLTPLMTNSQAVSFHHSDNQLDFSLARFTNRSCNSLTSGDERNSDTAASEAAKLGKGVEGEVGDWGV